MKHNPAEQIIRDRLEPGHISIEGFLGDDDRTIGDIIAADTGVVEAAGYTVKQLGDFLEHLHVTGDGGWESRVPMYDGKISVRSDETLGQIPCPFACGGHTHKSVITVKDADGENLMVFTPLDAHLIAEHGFFEGKGSPYRLEPSDVIALYELCHDKG